MAKKTKKQKDQQQLQQQPIKQTNQFANDQKNKDLKKDELPLLKNLSDLQSVIPNDHNINPEPRPRKVSFVNYLGHKDPLPKLTEEEFVQREHFYEQGLRATLGFFLKHSLREIGRRKFHFTLSFCSVFITVLSSLVINTVIERGPICFLKLAENHQGEIDAYVTPYGEYNLDQNYNNNLFLNYTRVVELYGKDKFNLSPRKYIDGVQMVYDFYSGLYDVRDMSKREQWFNTFNKETNLPRRPDVYKANFEQVVNVKLLAFKTDLEKELEIGREYQHPPMELGLCYMDKRNQQYEQDESLAIMKVPMTNLFRLIVEKYNNQVKGKKFSEIPFNYHTFHVKVPCRIQYTEQANGKNSPHNGLHIMIEYDKLLDLVSRYLPDPFNNPQYKHFREFLKSPLLMDEFSDQFAVTLPKPRFSHYENPDIEVVRAKISGYLQYVENALGFFPIHTTSDLLFELMTYSRGVMFLNLIFDLIFIILFIVSVLLIYSLLMSNIETKTFEIGLQRMFGLSKSGLVYMVVCQSILFVFPSIFAAFMASYPLLQGFALMMKLMIHIEVNPYPSTYSSIYALISGSLIPLLSSIIPIQIVLSKNLNDALDYNRSKTQAVYMEVLQKGKRNIHEMLTFGFIACAYGITVYYLLPLGLISFNVGLILKIFIIVLFSMLFALTLLALNLQRILEISLTYILLFFEQISIKMMVLKNLMAHRRRNQLTSIIFSLALGFTIFLIVAYKVQLEALRLHELRFKASYLQVQVGDSKYAMNPRLIEPALKKHMDIIDTISWIPCELDKISELRIKKSTLSDYSRINPQPIGIYGAQPSLFDTVYKEMYKEGYRNKSTGLGLIEQLYTARGSQSVGVGWVVPKKLGIDVEDYTQTMVMDIYSRIQNRMYQVRPVFTMAMAPGMTMPEEDLNLFNSYTVLVSLPMYATYARARIGEIPMERLLIKLKEIENPVHIKRVKTALNQQLENIGYSSQNYELKDAYQEAKGLEDASRILQLIFGIVIPFTMFLCLFSLSSSMSANLYDQSKELAIIRAIGFKTEHIHRLYIYESFILVTSSSILGICIGTFIGWTCAIQQKMFLDVPIGFIFPYAELLYILCLSMICAYISTSRPTNELIRRPIPSIFRNV